MLNDGGKKLGRVHLDLFGHFDLTGSGKQLVRPHAAQIGAQRILGKTGAFLGRQHCGGIFLTDVLVIAYGLVHQDVVFARGRFEHLHRQAKQLFGDFAQRLFVAHHVVGQMVVDFRHRHPASLTAQTHKRAVAVDHMIVAFGKRIRVIGHSIELFEFGKIFSTFVVGVHVEIDHIVIAHVVEIVVFGGRLATGFAAGRFAGCIGFLTLARLLGGSRFGGCCLRFFFAYDRHIAAHFDCGGLRDPLNGLKIGKDHIIDNFFEFFRHN